MSGFLHYKVTRSTPLTPEEENSIQKLIREANSVEDLDDLVADGEGEMFTGAEFPKDGKVLMSGSLKLPVMLLRDGGADEFLYVLEHWLDLLAAIRRLLGGTWELLLDRKKVKWDEKMETYETPGA